PRAADRRGGRLLRALPVATARRDEARGAAARDLRRAGRLHPGRGRGGAAPRSARRREVRGGAGAARRRPRLHERDATGPLRRRRGGGRRGAPARLPARGARVPTRAVAPWRAPARPGLVRRLLPPPLRELVEQVEHRIARFPTRLNEYG